MNKYVHTFEEGGLLNAPVAIEHNLGTKDLIVGSRLPSGERASNVGRVITQTDNLVVVEPSSSFVEGQTIILIG
jgi:hypothetical protein